ncbi:2-hydroxychromene-2-carboxylate isomerase [Marinobacter algicola]|uniref:2-hydroxychromene-2-carboxylate isomerase n=1 Tax=Marinobacter algicola TaxID=236100 RepID=UPI003BA96E13
MTDNVDMYLYFNFRSPYCYLGSKTMFKLLDDYHVNLIWRPLGGWRGRSAPERASKKMPIARQDMRRFARRLGIPVTPPPKTTDPTRAGAGSLLAEERGMLRPYVVEVMRAEWAYGLDIGDPDVLLPVGERVGLDRAELAEAIESTERFAQLERNWEEADRVGAFGVPTFVVGEEIFWGQDRIDFVVEHLRELGLARL